MVKGVNDVVFWLFGAILFFLLSGCARNKIVTVMSVNAIIVSHKCIHLSIAVHSVNMGLTCRSSPPLRLCSQKTPLMKTKKSDANLCMLQGHRGGSRNVCVQCCLYDDCHCRKGSSFVLNCQLTGLNTVF